MFNNQERLSMLNMMKKLREELPKAQAKAELAELARDTAGKYYDLVETDKAWTEYMLTSERYHDLSDMAESLERVSDYLKKIDEELNLLDGLGW